MTTQLTERATCGFPIGQAEVEYSRNRSHADRPPPLELAQVVGYRHCAWDEEATNGIVLAIQGRDAGSPPDFADPNMWRVKRDSRGAPEVTETGEPIMEQVPDPDPLVLLETPHGKILTREARVRGSAGWLPDDWRDRRYVLVNGVIMPATALVGVGEV